MKISIQNTDICQLNAIYTAGIKSGIRQTMAKAVKPADIN